MEFAKRVCVGNMRTHKGDRMKWDADKDFWLSPCFVPTLVSCRTLGGDEWRAAKSIAVKGEIG